MPHRRLLTVPLLLAAAFAVGCSSDRHIYHSSVNEPKSITLVDTDTDQSVWSMDIPANHTLVLNGSNRHDIAFLQVGNHPATSMTWKLYATEDVETAYTDMNTYLGRTPLDAGEVPLTGSPIRIDMSISDARPTPPPPVLTVPDAAPEAPAAPESSDAIEREMEESATVTEPMPEPPAAAEDDAAPATK